MTDEHAHVRRERFGWGACSCRHCRVPRALHRRMVRRLLKRALRISLLDIQETQ